MSALVLALALATAAHAPAQDPPPPSPSGNLAVGQHASTLGREALLRLPNGRRAAPTRLFAAQEPGFELEAPDAPALPTCRMPVVPGDGAVDPHFVQTPPDAGTVSYQMRGMPAPLTCQPTAVPWSTP